MAKNIKNAELNSVIEPQGPDEIDGSDIRDEDIAPVEIRTKTHLAAEIFEFFEMLIFASCVIMLLFSFVARICTVSGPSMNQTLTHGDKIIVSDLFYTPAQGDIIVFQDLDTINPNTLKPYEDAIIKRVIAIGGQTVVLHYEPQDGITLVTVEVDGKTLDEPYRYYDRTPGANHDRYTGTFEYHVPENTLFVMGDNTYHSEDSRGIFSFVETDKVLGRAVFRLSGQDLSSLFSKFGFI